MTFNNEINKCLQAGNNYELSIELAFKHIENEMIKKFKIPDIYKNVEILSDNSKLEIGIPEAEYTSSIIKSYEVKIDSLKERYNDSIIEINKTMKIINDIRKEIISIYNKLNSKIEMHPREIMQYQCLVSTDFKSETAIDIYYNDMLLLSSLMDASVNYIYSILRLNEIISDYNNVRFMYSNIENFKNMLIKVRSEENETLDEMKGDIKL